jgi:hypothetical protein
MGPQIDRLSSRLPRRFPVGAKYVVEGYGGEKGYLHVIARYVVLPGGRRINVPASLSQPASPAGPPHSGPILSDPRMALLYGPAARCKPKVMIWRSWSCASVSGLSMEPLSSWPSWISARARSHSRLGPEGHTGHLIANALARPFLHLLFPTRRPRRESQLLPSEISLSRQPSPW